MAKASTRADFALDDEEERIEALMRIETLLSPHAQERIKRACFHFADAHGGLSVARLRLVLQLEDHLDWLLRADQPKLALWRLDSRRADAIAFAGHTADMWQALGLSLGRYALQHAEWAKTTDVATGLLPLTIAVSLHCYVNEMRWRAQAGQNCDLPLKSLHRLYAIAEQRGVAADLVRPYEADVDFAISPQGQYVTMLLMADLAERDLPPAQRLVAQHWLSRWAAHVSLQRDYRAQAHSMMVDLNSASGIERIHDGMTATHRFLDIRPIARRIEEIDALLANSNGSDDTESAVPEANEQDLTETLSWLERLYHDRSAAFQATRVRAIEEGPRHVRAIAGWNAIAEYADASHWEAKSGRGRFPPKYPLFQTPGQGGTPAGELETVRDENQFMLWRVRDTSAGGMGLSVAHGLDHEYAVGTLIALSENDAQGWTIGRIVRKFKDLDGVDTRYGVQLLGHKAVPVKLTPRPPEGQVATTLMSSVTGLFLCESQEGGAQDLLLTSMGALAYTRRFELKTGAKRLAIRTALPVQSAGAWVLIRFEEDTQ
ncbi:MAG: PilZ domain-containing protein [Betaproteobacteria bacterium]|nr:PilZ domain-containing protein [Betaproteobacteria bacterium]